MVNPGAFPGTRKDFLAAQMDLYAAAVTENHVADTVADIQHRYFKRYPISLPHNEEPTAEWLAQVDDNAADSDELLPPDETLLDEEAFEAATATYEEQVNLLQFRKGQIAHRLAYQHGKSTNSIKHIEIGSEDPMTVLMAKIAGIPIKKPRLRTAYTVWGQNNRDIMDPIYDAQIEQDRVPPSKRAALRMRLYKEHFNTLGEDEKKEYEARAIDEHRVAIANIEQALNAPPSESPEARQQILRGLLTFVQPILNLITEYTGWKATLMVGGPEPADKGHLNVMSFHSGETNGSVKMNFGRSERRAYKEYVMPVFGNFLKKCYTVEECRAAALSDPTAVSLAEVLRLDGVEEFGVDSADSSLNYIKIARTPLMTSSGGAPSTPKTPNSPTVSRTGPPIHLQIGRAQASRTGSPLAQTPAMPPSTTELASQPAPASLVSFPPSPCHSVAPSPAPSPRASPAPMPQVSPTPDIRVVTGLNLPASPIPMPGFEAMQVPCVLPVQASPMPSSTPPLSARQRRALPAPTSRTSRSSVRTPQVLPEPVPNEQSAIAETVHENTRKRRHVNQDRADQSEASKPLDDRVDGAPRKRIRSTRDNRESTNTESRVSLTTESTEPLTPEELSGCPDWFLKAYQMLISKDLGPAWTQLIRQWARFEMEERYTEQGKLGTDGRPDCIGAWIARTRSATYKPNIGQLALFEKTFNTWWRGLQPKWRVEGARKSLQRREDGNLEGLCRPGKNGLLSLLAALFFWGVDAKKGGVKPVHPWKLAVDDVHWVLQNLTSK